MVHKLTSNESFFLLVSTCNVFSIKMIVYYVEAEEMKQLYPHIPLNMATIRGIEHRTFLSIKISFDLLIKIRFK